MALDISEQRASGLDLSERGRAKDGRPLALDERLYFQLQAFGGCHDAGPASEALSAAGIEGALYVNVNDPYGIGLLALGTDADHFVTELRDVLQEPPFTTYSPQPEYAMFGRTYAIGYESDLEELLLRRPHRNVCNPAWPWAIWYPLRRSGSFELLSSKERRTILMEHGGIGQAYGRADHAHDVRLACHGLDKNDNDFVVGLLGKDLHPLSSIVERMRKTQQTSRYLSQMGPFFVGKAVWQSAMP